MTFFKQPRQYISFLGKGAFQLGSRALFLPPGCVRRDFHGGHDDLEIGICKFGLALITIKTAVFRLHIGAKEVRATDGKAGPDRLCL